jgi:hypothetical protein
VEAVEIVEADPVTGRKTPLVATAQRALRALNRAGVPFAVIGATALGVRGLARFTADLDIVVAREDAFAALTALDDAGFTADPAIEPDTEPEAMYVMRHGAGSVDVLVASAEPESTVIAEAKRARISRDISAIWRASCSRPPSISHSSSAISPRSIPRCSGC